jgi:hypothetical protein
MPLRRADAHEELIDTEGFRDIIVGAKIERCDLGAFVLTIRKDDDRQGLVAIPDLSDDIEAIHVGQSKVEDDEIGRMLADHVERGVRIGGGGDDIALALQARVQKAKDRRLIIDDENTKGARAWCHNKASECGKSRQNTGSFMCTPLMTPTHSPK